MKVLAYQITPSRNIEIQSQASTLDELTRELPEGFYTTFSTLAHGSRVLGLKAHLKRLYGPAAELGIHPSIDEQSLRIKIAGIAALYGSAESRIRLVLTKNKGIIYVCLQAFQPLSETVYRNGVKVISTDLARKSPNLKDSSFITQTVSQRRQVGRDVFEVLLVRKDRILEGMTSNFYAVKGHAIITARHGILPGVTRRVILQLARGQGMSIQYRSPGLKENFDEAFLTSSTRGVVPIISIDNKSVGQGRTGNWTKLLSKAYQEYVGTRSELIVEQE